MNYCTRLLVVQNSDPDLEKIRNFLSGRYDAQEIARLKTIAEAADFLRSPRATNLEVVLLDSSVTGPYLAEAITALVSLCPRTPIIVLADDPAFGLSSRFIELGFSDYLLKSEWSAFSLQKSILYCIERYKLKISLLESEKRYSTLFQLSPVPMWVYDLKTLKFVDVNEAALKHYGYDKVEFLNMSIREIRPREDILLLEEAVKESLLSERNSYQGMFRHQKKNGEIIFVYIQSKVIFLNGRQSKLILANDITQHVHYDRTIKTQNQKLKEIAWIQCHVVRTPIARLMGLVDALEEEEMNEALRTELMAHIRTSAQELDTIVRDIAHKAQQVNANLPYNL
ncbi:MULTISPECIES: PAS domain S-box protein [unclassified Siphonobacter]|uniref:PAS domain S-box protein n=1 Tax=unclassified Siphonobacter TaxID=2635712 RepID=UPI001304E862|nr:MULTISPECIES: PAS domain S-box protein [unclassified Siphonobacter]